MLCACIDIGSNTTRLLVAEAGDGRLREVLQQRAFTRLGGKGGIGAEKIARCCEAVSTQMRVAAECGVERVRVIGTAAIRSAPNREELLAAIEEAAGVRVEVLSGEDEARFAFLGATHMLGHLPLGDVGVVDVGGGSTEIVVGTLSDGVKWAESFRVGSAYLADHYLRSDPPALGELEHLRRHVQGVFEGLDVPRPRVAYAVGGSATSLRRLVGASLDHEALQRGVRLLAELPIAEVARRFELHPERVRLLPAGMLLLDAASDVLGGVPLSVANGGLREGVLLAELDREGVLP
jgi:exopolyphosphatase/guanosine-5'-triphosphate,3'-diphosphate pyrophosphatase